MASANVAASAEEVSHDLVSYVKKVVADTEGADAAVVEDCGRLLRGKEFVALVRRMLDLGGSLFNQNEKDVEGCFHILGALLAQLSVADRAPLVQRVVELASASTDAGSASLRLSIMANLYNVLTDASQERFPTFRAIVDYASRTNQLDLLTPYLDSLHEMRTWHVTDEQRVDVYLLAADSLDAASKNAQAQAMLVKLLASLQSADDAALARYKHVAARVAVGALQTPILSQSHNLVHLRAVQQLKSDAAHARLYELLRIFTHERVSAFVAFYEANKEYVDSLGVSFERAMENIRLLTLCSLGAEVEELSYELAARELQVGEDEVEYWVVLAIKRKMMDARMDQLHRVIKISRAAQRVFDTAQWAQLQSRLSEWRDSVGTMLSTVHRLREERGM